MTQAELDIVKAAASRTSMQQKVYDLGSRVAIGQENYANIHKFFKEAHYVGIDMSPGMNVNLVAGAHNVPLPSNSADLVLCLSMLEHDTMPWLTIATIRRILKPGGTAIISVPFNWEIHEHPYDYRRWTPDGLRLELTQCLLLPNIVESVGNKKHPYMIIAVITKDIDFWTTFLATWVKKWKRREISNPILRRLWRMINKLI